ncbi:truncated dihydropteroate synthetase [Klebsiella pneumoniae]|nr:truncated dihydropteroate synthetase [Klebsiella pneumoniae]
MTVFGILNLTEDSFFDESRRLDPAGAVTAAIEMLRVGSDVVDVGPAASHPDARPVSPADEIRRIAPLLDALSDQMHRVSIDSFQPETQRYALKRGVGYLNDIQGFPDPALYPDIAEADCRLVVMHSAPPPAPVTFDPKTRSTRLCGSSRRGFPPCDGAGSLPTGSSSIRGWDFS